MTLLLLHSVLNWLLTMNSRNVKTSYNLAKCIFTMYVFIQVIGRIGTDILFKCCFISVLICKIFKLFSLKPRNFIQAIQAIFEQ